MLQGTEEWLRERSKRIGASDAPIIMGVSPYKTIDKLLKEKRKVQEEGISFEPMPPHMQRGMDLEEPARRKYEELTGVIVFPRVIHHPRHPWMMASLDGMDLDDQVQVEIKCGTYFDPRIKELRPCKAHVESREGVVPHKYFPQLQHQLECTGLQETDYFSYFNDDDYVLLTVSRDDQYIEMMLEYHNEFYKMLQE
jgi:putative phage-type endonuclease